MYFFIHRADIKEESSHNETVGYFLFSDNFQTAA